MADDWPAVVSATANDDAPSPLQELYASWGVFDLFRETLDQLPPEWLVIFTIARNLMGGKGVPGITIPEALDFLIRGSYRVEYEPRMVGEITYKETELPTDSLIIRPIRSLTEVSRSLPSQLLLRELSPTLFWLKAITGSLLIARFQEPQVLIEEKHGTREVLVPVLKQQSSPRQKVYVLLDTSQSMEEDGKLTFAKAVILAYLLRARDEEAEIYFRHFTTVVSERSDCRTGEEFSGLAERVLHLEAGGSTNLAVAIRTAVEDIDTIDHLARVQAGTTRPAPTELLLISDCASFSALPRITSAIKLHTIHLESGNEQSDTPLDYARLVADIRERSETYTAIDTSTMTLPASEDEAAVVRKEILDLEEQVMLGEHDHPITGEQVRKRAAQVRRMAQVYKRVYDAAQDSTMEEIHLSNSDMADGLFVLMTWDGVKDRARKLLEHAMKTKTAMLGKLKRLNQRQERGFAPGRFRIRGP